MSKKKKKINPKDYEEYSHGPFKIKRSGRFVEMSSNWEKSDHDKFLANVQKGRPNLKKDIDKKIGRLLFLINNYNPFDFISVISLENCFGDPEEYTESTYEGKEYFVEFTLSLILTRKKKKDLPHATKDIIDEFIKLISETMNQILEYFGSEFSEGKQTKIEAEIRFKMIARYLMGRGDSYIEHHLEMIRDIFQPHNDFFREHYGYDSDKIISILDNICNQPAINLQKQKMLMIELHDKFKNFVDSKTTDKFSSNNDILEQYFASSEFKEEDSKFKEKLHFIADNPFKITPSLSIPKEILDLLSSQFGENELFAKIPGFNAWPTNYSIINIRPLIKEKEIYYCFIPQIIFRQMKYILEEMILNKSKKYYENIFLRRQSKFLEIKTLEYLSKLMPGAKVFHSLYYRIKEAGEIKRAETDGLILFDNNLFIIEAKSGHLSPSSKRGGLIKLRDDLKEIIEKGFEQAVRTQRYIKEASVPIFENEDGSEALKIDDITQYKNIYLINTTLQNLDVLASHMPSLKNWGYLKGTEWPWNVFINDLKVISEILDSPTLFLLYLQRRIRANDYPQFHAHDELDFLMYYLKNGLFFDDASLQNLTAYIPHAYTEDLDRYYDFKGGRVSSGTKPKMQIDKEYKELLREIELSGQPGFSHASSFLLGFNIRTRKKILESIDNCKVQVLSDGNEHNFTMHSSDKIGLTYSASKTMSLGFLEKMDNYCAIKLYQTKFEEWVLIIATYKENSTKEFIFRIFKKKWKYDMEMEKQVEKFKEYRIKKFKNPGIKIGRNKKCPCGSGLKYKKCCGR